MNLEKLKQNYDRHFLPIGVLRHMVKHKLITAEQFKEITGKDY